MNLLGISYYPYGETGVVLDRLNEIGSSSPDAFDKLVVDLKVLRDEGLRSRRINVRPMGEGLWELKRLFAGVQYRIFFCVAGGRLWLLHALEKKSAKTPTRELSLARRRMREVWT